MMDDIRSLEKSETPASVSVKKDDYEHYVTTDTRTNNNQLILHESKSNMVIQPQRQ